MRAGYCSAASNPPHERHDPDSGEIDPCPPQRLLPERCRCTNGQAGLDHRQIVGCEERNTDRTRRLLRVCAFDGPLQPALILGGRAALDRLGGNGRPHDGADIRHVVAVFPE